MEYKSKNVACQNCKKNFTIAPDDFGFYEKIAVPPPTFCPECRLQRRFMRRNERALNMRTCSGTGNKIVSVYDASASFPVYSREYWYSDNWDGTDYGKEYDFSKPFFEQLIDLSKVAPRLNLWQVNTIDSEYSNYIVDSKNCYLCFTALANNEDCMYSSYLTESINCLDCDHITKCERCYECFDCDSCYNCKWSVDSSTCRDSWFLRDCANCSNCFGCVELRDKQYCIFNQQYSKEDYTAKLEELGITSRTNFPDFEKKTNSLWLKFPRRYMQGKKNTDVTGNYALNSGKCYNAFFINNCEEAKNLFFTLGLKNSMDVTVSPVQNELLYECHAIPKQNYNIKFSDLCSNGSSNIEYSSNCDSSENLFGCIGLRKKEYCILNKQYTKEAYETLIPKIKKQMQEMPYQDKAGHKYGYGEFFPPELSPFAYNESVAQEHFPLAKAEIENLGYRWKDLKDRGYKITMKAETVPDKISILNDNITSEVIGCMNKGKGEDNCQTAFRILPNELIFYKQNNLPIPLFCPNCRHLTRLQVRNPLKLWHSQCMCKKNHPHHKGQCGVQFETSYAPERPEIVYCEKCYQAEVY